MTHDASIRCKSKELGIVALEAVAILEVDDALAMRLAREPLALKDAALKEEGAMAFSLASTPLPSVGGSIRELHDAKAIALALAIAKAQVEVPGHVECSS